MACREPGDEPALLDTALSVIMRPLPQTAPLWSAVLITGPAGSTLAVVIVLHHALADGVGGLAVLAQLIDGPSHAPDVCFPRSVPAPASLARDAFAARLAALRQASQSLHLLRESMGAGGGLRPPRAAPCSLNQPTGLRRQLAVVRADLAAVRTAAHRHGATTNDAVLVAVAGALHQVLAIRGEPVDTLVMTVPVSGRRADGGPPLGGLCSAAHKPPCGVPVSDSSRSPSSVKIPDFRNAFTRPQTRLSLILTRNRSINAVCEISSKEPAPYYGLR